jgi:hypothetical protein
VSLIERCPLREVPLYRRGFLPEFSTAILLNRVVKTDFHRKSMTCIFNIWEENSKRVVLLENHYRILISNSPSGKPLQDL